MFSNSLIHRVRHEFQRSQVHALIVSKLSARHVAVILDNLPHVLRRHLLLRRFLVPKLAPRAVPLRVQRSPLPRLLHHFLRHTDVHYHPAPSFPRPSSPRRRRVVPRAIVVVAIVPPPPSPDVVSRVASRARRSPRASASTVRVARASRSRSLASRSASLDAIRAPSTTRASRIAACGMGRPATRRPTKRCLTECAYEAVDCTRRTTTTRATTPRDARDDAGARARCSRDEKNARDAARDDAGGRGAGRSARAARVVAAWSLVAAARAATTTTTTTTTTTCRECLAERRRRTPVRASVVRRARRGASRWSSREGCDAAARDASAVRDGARTTGARRGAGSAEDSGFMRGVRANEARVGRCVGASWRGDARRGARRGMRCVRASSSLARELSATTSRFSSRGGDSSTACVYIQSTCTGA